MSELRDLVRRFSSLIRHGTGSVEENERQLAVLCDQLGLFAHSSREHARPGHFGDIPERDHERTRALVTARFPRFGYYNTAANTTVGIGRSEVVVGDATDDITDIADELAAVEWCLENTGEPDALWHFFDGHDNHWGEHLRRLQLYLYCLDRGL
jgi:hypothetical protein